MSATETENVNKTRTIIVDVKRCGACGHEWRERAGKVGHCPQCQSMKVTEARARVKGCKCERCQHEWQPRWPEREIRVCPSCKSPWWNLPRQNA